MRAIVLIAVAGLVLTACGRRDEAEAPPPAAASPAPAALSPPTAARKAGLWEQSVSIAGVDYPQTTRVCLDAASDAALSWAAGPAGETCTHNRTRQADGSWTFSSTCAMGSGGTVTTTGTARGDFDRHYEVRAETATSGAALEQMNGMRAVAVVADWRGPCPDGMRGGEALLPGGLRMNLLEAGGG